MNIWPTHSLWFVCLVYFSLTSSKSLEPTYVEKLNEALLEMSDGAYDGFLIYSIPAASDGKNLFKMPDGLSEDCIRTARAIMQSFAKPSTTFRTLYVMYRSYTKAARGKSNSLFQKQVNMTCNYLNEEVKKWPSDFANFEELKMNVELPNPAKNYIYIIPSERNIKDWLYSVSMNMDDPEMFKYETVLQFQKFKRPVSDVNRLDYMGTARAIDKLSERAIYKSTVDSVFTRALEDYTNELMPQKVDKYAAAHTPGFVKKVDQYFLKHPLLKEEYKKIKKQAIKEEQNANANE